MTTAFHDALACWHMADLNDSAGRSRNLTPAGNVEAGVHLVGEEREGSLIRGGDGRAAEFDGGWLSADLGAQDFGHNAMTLCVRLRASGEGPAPVLSISGSQKEGICALFFGDVAEERALVFELATAGSEKPFRVSVPAALVGLTEWHDLIMRYNGAKLQLFVDGALLDEEFPTGLLRPGGAPSGLIGARWQDGEIRGGFHGLMDHVAIWNRALTEDEVAALSGGHKAVARRVRQLTNYGAASMQYWKPSHQANVGDCLPFFHGGKFHFAYLLDWGHHSRKGGKGAHQWAQAISTDLLHWEHQPMLVEISDQREGSICTGSLFFHDEVYYAFYATRFPEHPEALSLATSADGVRFKKTEPNPFAVPQPGYSPRAYRDPHIFQDGQTGLFHMLVTASLDDPGIPPDQRGALAHLVSKDLKSWELTGPFVQGLPHTPECPDYFFWNGWYYLIFSQGGRAIYRMSRAPLGPWEKPKEDLLASPMARVMKTAAFTGNRRIGAAFLPTFEGRKDNGRHRYAGRAYFVELLQNRDGGLGTKFLAEMIPRSGDPLKLAMTALTPGVSGDPENIRMNARGASGMAMLAGVPDNVRITLRASPSGSASGFGLRLKASDGGRRGYDLLFKPSEERVQLFNHSLNGVAGLDRPFDLDIVLQEEVMDVCIDNRRTLVNLGYDLRGDQVCFFAEDADVSFDSIQVRRLSNG